MYDPACHGPIWAWFCKNFHYLAWNSNEERKMLELNMNFMVFELCEIYIQLHSIIPV